jgi:hypothetical protein
VKRAPSSYGVDVRAVTLGIAKLGSQRTALSPHDTFTPRFSFLLLPPSHTALALVASDVLGWIVDRKWNGRVVSTVGYC